MKTQVQEALEEIAQETTELCAEIEKIPAGLQQTKVSLLASDLRKKIAALACNLPRSV